MMALWGIPVVVKNWSQVAPLENLYIAISVVASEHPTVARVGSIEAPITLGPGDRATLEFELPKGFICVRREGTEWAGLPWELYRRMWVDEGWRVVRDGYLGYAPKPFIFDPYIIKRRKVVIELENKAGEQNRYFLDCEPMLLSEEAWERVNPILFDAWRDLFGVPRAGVEAFREATVEELVRALREVARTMPDGGDPPEEPKEELEVRVVGGRRVIRYRGVWLKAGPKLLSLR